VQKLREIGLQPDILLCWTEHALSKDAQAKIGLFANLQVEAVIEALDVPSIYQVPLCFEEQHLSDLVVRLLRIKARKPRLGQWKRFVAKIQKPKQIVRIAIAGKYVELRDAYKSIIEAFVHAGVENNARVELVWVDTQAVEREGAEPYLKDVSGLLIPGGFGERGTEGKILTVKYARENDLPFFGICLGLQTAVIEFARSQCGLAGATSREFETACTHPVIDYMPDQDGECPKGGTMRLGAYPCNIKKGTLAQRIYGQERISERHRHRLEVNNDYRSVLESKGMVFSGVSPDNRLVEIIELPELRWFLGVQYHPEFKSRAIEAHPLFRSFVGAALAFQKAHRNGK
jgi:CTP synthase